jgi:hypothetical protein
MNNFDSCPCCGREYDDTPVKPKKAPASDFDAFWKAYPKKIAKGYCEAIWKRKELSIDLVLPALKNAISSREWQKDGGQFIPNPSTWLNQGRWEDEGIDLVALKPERPSFLKPTQKVDHQDYIAWKAREEYPPSILETQFREDPDFIQQTYLKQLTK